MPASDSGELSRCRGAGAGLRGAGGGSCKDWVPAPETARGILIRIQALRPTVDRLPGQKHTNRSIEPQPMVPEPTPTKSKAF